MFLEFNFNQIDSAVCNMHAEFSCYGQHLMVKRFSQINKFVKALSLALVWVFRHSMSPFTLTCSHFNSAKSLHTVLQLNYYALKGAGLM